MKKKLLKNIKFFTSIGQIIGFCMDRFIAICDVDWDNGSMGNVEIEW